MVFWWTGRGFLAVLFLVGTFGVFGATITFAFGDMAFAKWPWLWGVGFLLAAVVNWVAGCRLNRAPINPLVGTVRERLTYRPPNRFLSLPPEVWSGPVALLGIAAIAKGLI
jgi:hypothetical protein